MPYSKFKKIPSNRCKANTILLNFSEKKDDFIPSVFLDNIMRELEDEEKSESDLECIMGAFNTYQAISKMCLRNGEILPEFQKIKESLDGLTNLDCVIEDPDLREEAQLYLFFSQLESEAVALKKDNFKSLQLSYYEMPLEVRNFYLQCAMNFTAQGWAPSSSNNKMENYQSICTYLIDSSQNNLSSTIRQLKEAYQNSWGDALKQMDDIRKNLSSLPSNESGFSAPDALSRQSARLNMQKTSVCFPNKYDVKMVESLAEISGAKASVIYVTEGGQYALLDSNNTMKGGYLSKERFDLSQLKPALENHASKEYDEFRDDIVREAVISGHIKESRLTSFAKTEKLINAYFDSKTIEEKFSTQGLYFETTSTSIEQFIRGSIKEDVKFVVRPWCYQCDRENGEDYTEQCANNICNRIVEKVNGDINQLTGSGVVDITNHGISDFITDLQTKEGVKLSNNEIDILKYDITQQIAPRLVDIRERFLSLAEVSVEKYKQELAKSLILKKNALTRETYQEKAKEYKHLIALHEEKKQLEKEDFSAKAKEDDSQRKTRRFIEIKEKIAQYNDQHMKDEIQSHRKLTAQESLVCRYQDFKEQFYPVYQHLEKISQLHGSELTKEMNQIIDDCREREVKENQAKINKDKQELYLKEIKSRPEDLSKDKHSRIWSAISNNRSNAYKSIASKYGRLKLHLEYIDDQSVIPKVSQVDKKLYMSLPIKKDVQRSYQDSLHFKKYGEAGNKFLQENDAIDSGNVVTLNAQVNLSEASITASDSSVELLSIAEDTLNPEDTTMLALEDQSTSNFLPSGDLAFMSNRIKQSNSSSTPMQAL
ncbi:MULTISPECIES: hypothetical protein [Cysteiniphilum]|uniref:hypothetical protein n=1 Tax=Cysteiniphilum TaxID=2056696 RepID=UPI00177C13E1|nr:MULTISPECIES: hypothetical protein [Cysteiniphilum]